MRTLRNVALLTVVMAAATWLLAWWVVPLIAASVAVWERRARTSVVHSTLAAALAWGVLLVIQSLFGSSVAVFAADLAASLGVAPAVPLLLTVLLPALLAASAAATVAAIKHLRARPPAIS